MANTSRSYTMDLTQFQDYCDRTARQLSSIDFSQPLKRSLLILKSYTLQNFDGGHSPDGVPWVKLKRPRPRGGSQDKPLRDRDILMASIAGKNPQAENDYGPGHFQSIDGNTLVWGTNIPYAWIHQHGGTINRPERTRARPWVFPGPDGRPIFTRRIRAHTILIPARPFLGINAEMEGHIKDAFSEFLGELAGGNAGGGP